MVRTNTNSQSQCLGTLGTRYVHVTYTLGTDYVGTMCGLTQILKVSALVYLLYEAHYILCIYRLGLRREAKRPE
jgi:hypothetical protein